MSHNETSSWKVLKENPSFRWFLLTWYVIWPWNSLVDECRHSSLSLLSLLPFPFSESCRVCKDMGDWLVKVANMILVQQWAGTGAALSGLVLCSLIPKAIAAPLGGYLSDRFYRPKLMCTIDAIAGFVVLLYLMAVQRKSVVLVYIITAIRSFKAALYYPLTNAMLPVLLSNKKDMQYGSSLLNGVYGIMSVVGGLMAGSAAVLLGVTTCYLVDSLTYWTSSTIMYCRIWGAYRKLSYDSNTPKQQSDLETASMMDDSKADKAQQPKEQTFLGGTRQVYQHLVSCGCLALVFLKGTDSLIWGPGDVLGVEVGTVRMENGIEDEALSSYRIGLFYSCTGLGVTLGPNIANFFSDAEKPVTLQQCCCASIFVAMTGWIAAGLAPSFNWFLVASFWSGLAYGVLWSYSSLLLQILVDTKMLGRVLSLEYLIFVSFEAISSSITGPLFDMGYSTDQLCFWAAGLAAIAMILWTGFHLSGGGAANTRFKTAENLRKFNQYAALTTTEKDASTDTRDPNRALSLGVELLRRKSSKFSINFLGPSFGEGGA